MLSSYFQFNQQNNYNNFLPNNNNHNQTSNPMTVSGTLRTPAKSIHNYMCYGTNHCSSHGYYKKN